MLPKEESSVKNTLVVFSQPTLKNSLYLTILSPQSYYITTELKNVKKVSGNIGNFYEKRVEKLNAQKTGTKKNEIGIKIDLNKSLADKLGIDEVFPIKFLIDSSSDLEKNKKQMGMECKVGEEKFIGLDMLMDLEKEGTDYLEISFYDMEDEGTSFTIKGNGKEEESTYKGETVLENKSGNSTKNTAKIYFDNTTTGDKKHGVYNGEVTLETNLLFAR